MTTRKTGRGEAWQKGGAEDAGKGRRYKVTAREGGEVSGRTSKRTTSQSKVLHKTLVMCSLCVGFPVADDVTFKNPDIRNTCFCAGSASWESEQKSVLYLEQWL